MNQILQSAARLAKRAGARFLLYWAGLFGLLSAGAACPFCGQAGCPAGAASAGFLAAVLAALTGLFRRRRKHEACEHPHQQPANPPGPSGD